MKMHVRYEAAGTGVFGRRSAAESTAGLNDAVLDDGQPSRARMPRESKRHVQLETAGNKLAPAASGQCDALQTNLWLRYPETSGTPVTMFVGAAPGCGASTIASAFVDSLARDRSSRILLIDFGARPRTEVPEIAAGADLLYLLDTTVRTSSASACPPNVHVLSGLSFGNVPPSFFQSSSFDRFLEAARDRFDHVIVDAPALQRHPESLVLSRKADGVVLVVHAGRTRKQTALWAKQQIENASGNLLGVVLNRRKFYVPRWLYECL